MPNIRILILTLGVFSIISTEMGVTGILPVIADAYDVSVSTAGLLVSLFALAITVAGPTLPPACSGMRRKPVMAFVLAAFTAGNVVAAFAPNFAVLLAARVVPAFLQPVYTSLAFTEAAGSVRPEEAPKASAGVMMGVSAGMVLGVPVVTALVDATSLSVGFLFFALVNGASLAALLIVLPRGERGRAVGYGDQLRNLARLDSWRAILAVVALNGGVFAVFSYLSDYLGTVAGMAAMPISGVLLAYGLANLVGNGVGGQGLTRRPRRFVLVVPALTIAVFALLAVFGRSPAAAAGLLVVAGVLAGCVGVINQYWINDAMPQAPEFANGVFLAATNLGTTIGTSLNAAVIASIGVSGIMAGGVALLVPALALFAWRVAPAGARGRLRPASGR
ncbi:MFS transporter [Bifidobacterium phasiani]|uniref:MFS transporter n=1 Tax=Bifidobacterium phasiani TaxID=2834431 RepID=A0ABS6W642_9BIFI|nr:MFS transporter [Bifidobacterium phasiani]MBW3081912.1 MFS transporter [Bifidobacterium phasiani]